MSVILRQFFQLSTLSLIGYPLGFILQMLMSYYFGTSYVVDAYWVAITLVNLFGFYILPMREALVAGYHQQLREDPSGASPYFSAIINLIALLLFLSCLLLFLFPQFWTKLILNPEHPQTFLAVMELLPYCVLLIPMIALTDIYNGMLVSLGKVFFQDVGRIIGAALSILCLFLLADSHGIVTMVFAAIAANAVLLVVQRKQAQQLGLRYRPTTPPRLNRKFGSMSGALIVSYFCSQIYILFERSVFLRLGEGTVAGFQYAISLNNVMQAVFIGSLCNVLWPKILEKQAKDDELGNQVIVFRSIKNLFILLSFLIVFCWIYADHLVYLLFFRGEFGYNSLQMTSGFFRSVLLALLPLAVSAVLGRLFVCRQNVHSLFSIGLTSALGGVLVLSVARYLGSLQLAGYHTAVSALFGALASLVAAYYLFGRGFFSDNFSRFSSWCGLLAGTCLLIGALLYFLPIDWEIQKIEILGGLVWRFALGALFFFAIVFVMGLIRWGEWRDA